MSFSNYLVFIALGAVALVLFIGLWTMMRGKDPRISQNLMRWRVLLQFAAIIIFVLIMYFSGR